ncbi:MAG: YggT family protein [Gammaproteobacteria bacterium]|jgi:YggT family protein|nr:YggT family protein [Gammaproteobacteria bacterium]
MGNYAGNAGVFLIQTLFGLYLVAVMLRFLLQMTRADFYNPVSQFLVKITNPPLIPMRRLIPGLIGIDMAAVVLLIAIQAVELILVGLVQGFSLGIAGLLVLTVAELINLLLNIYFFTILIQVILSWVNPGGYNPAVALLYSLNEPILSRARRLIPPISGFDLSPIVVFIGIKLIQILLVAPIADMGKRLAFG